MHLRDLHMRYHPIYSGKHRCPKPHIKGDFQTNYNNHYRQIHQKVNPQPPPTYQYKERHYRPEALLTRYQQTYVNRPQYVNEDLNKSRLENIGVTVQLYRNRLLGRMCLLIVLHLTLSSIGLLLCSIRITLKICTSTVEIKYQTTVSSRPLSWMTTLLTKTTSQLLLPSKSKRVHILSIGSQKCHFQVTLATSKIINSIKSSSLNTKPTANL